MRKEDKGSLQTRVSQFLLRYRITPHTVTGISLSELLLGRRIRTRLDLLLPSLAARVSKKQHDQVTDKNKHAKTRTANAGDQVSIRDLPSRKGWLPGEVISVRGSQAEVRLTDGRIFSRHLDDVLHRSTPTSTQDEGNPEWLELPTSKDSTVSPGTDTPIDPPSLDPPAPSPPSRPIPAPRRTTRISRPPDRYEPES